MPPNVKENAAVVDSLATLDVKSIVNSKYLPLTQEQQPPPRRIEKKEEIITAPHVQDASHPSGSYWDWPAAGDKESSKQELIQRILRDEEARQILSVAHTLETLTKAQPKQDVKYVTAKHVDQDDAYWDMPEVQEEEDESQFEVAQHVKDESHPKNDYWNWSASSQQEQKAALIAKILKEEEIRQRLSVQHLEENLTKEPHEPCAMVTSGSAGDPSYWDW